MKIKDKAGHSADHRIALPVNRWSNIAKHTYREASRNNLGLIAAGVAFYGFLALVPVLGALVLTVGLVFEPMVIVREFASVAPSLPTEVANLVAEQLDSLIATSSTKKGLGLLMSLGLALFGAMKGAGAVTTALNIAYEVENRRDFVAENIANLLITLGAIFLCITLLVATSVSHAVGTILGTGSYVAALLIKIAGWALAAAITIAGLAALYRYAPSRANARWRWLTPGSIFATIGLLAASSAFGWYAANFGNYNATYGSLGAVVVVLMWLYLSAYALLLGAELNAEIEHQSAGNTATGAVQIPGKREAVRSDDAAD